MDDVRVSEFRRLFAVSGWKKARVARELSVSPSVVGRYLTGETVPSETVLKLFARMVGSALFIPNTRQDADAPPGAADGHRWMADWEQRLVDSVGELDQPARDVMVTGIVGLMDAVKEAIRNPGYVVGEAKKTQKPQ
jgi:transcriptional regulator with XRE-family HTH domain